MKILIIGGSGHVSGALARSAVAKGHEVWTITRGRRPLPEGVHSLIADRHDHDAMEKVIAEQEMAWDLVVDCICYELPDIRQDMQLFRRRASQFVLVSTDFVYDPARRRFPQPEETEYWAGTGGATEYGCKKRRCEEELVQGDTGDLAWTIVRPCHIYGAPSELGCLPLHGRDPRLIERLRHGESLQLVGGGHFLQQPVLVDDLADTILSVAGNHDACRAVFNVAGPDIIESWQYYQIVADVLGEKLTVEEIPVGPYLEGHPETAPFLCHRIYDLRRIEACKLSLPSTAIADGLRLHVEDLLSAGNQTRAAPER